MTDKKDDIEFLPDIYQFLDESEDIKSVNISAIEEIAYKIHASTSLSKEASFIVLRLFFQEIRGNILQGNTVVLANLGKFFLSTPKTSNNKKRIFPKFKPYKKLLGKLNDK
jgi:nucleoid DNA-binding protein